MTLLKVCVHIGMGFIVKEHKTRLQSTQFVPRTQQNTAHTVSAGSVVGSAFLLMALIGNRGSTLHLQLFLFVI